MEYKIISGRTEEIRRVWMPTKKGGQRIRRGTRAKKSSIRKIMRNEINAVKSLARTLNCNFGTGDVWLTLSFGEGEISWEDAQAVFDRFLRKLRALYRKEQGANLKYVYSHGRKNEIGNARPHFHIVLAAIDYESICALWPEQGVTYRRLDGSGDYTGIARYMISNAKGEEGKKKFHPSRGLEKPVYTEPVPVCAHSKMKLPKDASIRAVRRNRAHVPGHQPHRRRHRVVVAGRECTGRELLAGPGCAGTQCGRDVESGALPGHGAGECRLAGPGGRKNRVLYHAGCVRDRRGVHGA